MKKSIICFGLTVLGLTTLAQQKLQYNLEINKSYTNKHSVTADINTKVMGMNVPMKMDIEEELSLTPTKFENGIYTLNVLFKQLKTNMTVSGNSIIMDSNGDTTHNPMNSIFANMVNNPFELKIQQNGKILEVNGIDAILENSFQKLSLPDDAKSQLSASLKKSVNIDALSTQLNVSGMTFPDKAVKVGDSWSNDFTMNSQNIQVEYIGTYEIKELTPNYALIHANAVANKEKSSVEATIAGNIKVDVKSGWIIDADGNNTLKGVTKVDNPMDPSVDKMNVNIDVKSNFKHLGTEQK